ncbi:DUF4937 domain-containing protein [Kribbella sp. NPDC049227]|uniref:DUF4937 domain-containing protein n=1 Tax=Kribbella sp. NPDC049227 TaxID=3364113 RepID=UPI00371E79FE
MLLKWIRCAVSDRGLFDQGQQDWAGLQGIPGFLGQRGGWDTNASSTAHIFGLWAEPGSYQAFMRGPHDQLAKRQVGTYTDIDVRVYETLQIIGHPPGDVAGGEMLRVARCEVYPPRVSHFTDVQASVWNPGMIRAPGFQGGLLARRDANEFLVVTQWESAVAHNEYRREHFPRLHERAEPTRDLQFMIGHEITLETAWYVPPTT